MNWKKFCRSFTGDSTWIALCGDILRGNWGKQILWTEVNIEILVHLAVKRLRMT